MDTVFAVQQIAPLPDDVPAMCGHEPHHVGVRDDSHFHRRRIIEQVALCPADQAGRRQMPDDAPGRTPRLGWQPEDGDATRPQHAQELGQIVIDRGARQVLQHQSAVDQVEVTVGKLAQVRCVVEDEPNVLGAPVESPGGLQHGRSYVHADDLVRVWGECLRQSADAAAEVEHPLPAGGQAELAKLADVPSTSVRPVARNSPTSHRPPRLPGSTSTAQSGSSAPSLVQSRRTSFRCTSKP